MKQTRKNTTRFMPIGMCFGVGIGCAFGSFYDNIPIGLSLGISLGLCFGALIGRLADNNINKQLEEKAYTVKSTMFREESNDWAVTVADKDGNETTVTVPAPIMKDEAFTEGDYVYLSENNTIEQAFDKNER